MCASITCWQHTPITHFMFVSFHDAIRILAYPWRCTNRLCPLFFFCVVLFHKCMQCRTIRLFAFPLLRISSLRYALPLLCVSNIASPFGALPLLVVCVLLFAVHRHTIAYLFCYAPCFAFAFLCLFFTSQRCAFALMTSIDALPVETTFAAVSPLAESFLLAIIQTLA